MPGARMRRRKKAREERAAGEGREEGDEDAPLGGASLFGDDEDADDDVSQLKVNEKFKKRFEHNEKLKDSMRLKELEKEMGSDSDSEEEDDDGELLTEDVDALILDTLARIKKKDPKIYDAKTKFFDSKPLEEQQREGEDKDSKKKKEKKFTVTDYAREQLLKGNDGADSSEEEEKEEEEEESLTYAQEQSKLKDMFKDNKKKETKKRGFSDDEESDDDLFKPRTKTSEEQRKEDHEYREFARERLAEKNPTQTLATLLKPDEGELDTNELWLRQYVLGNEWKREDDALPTYKQIVGDEDSEADEEEIKRQEDFEEAYNFRFEQKGSDNIVGHARKIEGSVRREESKRKEKRQKKQERVESEMSKRKEELQRLKNAKKADILARLKKIQELSKAKHIDSDVIDLDADFDPAEHDKKMAQVYDDEYYGEEEDDEHPFANEADQEFLDAIGWEGEDDEADWEGEGYEEEGGGGGEGEAAGGKKGKKKSKKELQKEERDAARREKRKDKSITEEELETQVKQVSGLDKYLDEYYNLDFEGMAGDVPTRFKYRETEAVDVGLTAEEILALDDADLRQVMPMSYFGAPYKSIPPKMLKSLKAKAKAAIRKLQQQEEGGEEERGEGGGGKGVKRGKDKVPIEEDRFASYGLGKDAKDAGGKRKGDDEEREKKKRKYDQAHRLHAGVDKKSKERKPFRGDAETEGKPSRLTKFDED